MEACSGKVAVRRRTVPISPVKVPRCIRSADEFDGLVGQRRAPASAVRIGPAPSYKCPVPGEDGLRRDEECRPLLSRHKTSEEGDERPIRPGEAGTGDSSAQHGQLMPQDQDLGVFGHGVHLVDADSLEHATHQAVEEGKPHGGRACPCSSSLVKAAVVLLDPSGSTVAQRPQIGGSRFSIVVRGRRRGFISYPPMVLHDSKCDGIGD